jgi:signal transduction histidine kinase
MLSPVEMERNGLRAALEEMAETTEKIYDVSCRVFQEGNFFVEDNQAATHLFYIAREAVTNSIKHGRAGRIAIRLIERGGVRTVTVRDDGSGAPEGPADTGLGLRIMRYRAGIIGADFSAGNIEEGGFEVTVMMREEAGEENGGDDDAG